MAYRYFSTERPIAPGTYPIPYGCRVHGIENYDERTYIPEIRRYAWGCITYNNPLKAKEASDYDLVIKSCDYEDKKAICEALCKALQLTKGASDLTSLDYDYKTETVTAVFAGEETKLNVAWDSGTEMIRDIMRNLRC